MQKIYVLLRHDKQTGPYSLEEIAQFDLKPYDLIWIEGKSAGWYYPQEIAALHPHLNFLPQKPKPVVQAAASPEKKVFIAMPSAAKEEVPPVVPLSPEPLVHVPQETVKPSQPVSKNLEEEVFAQFKEPMAEKEAVAATPVAVRKKRSASPVGVAIATVLVVGGVFAASWVMNRHSAEEDTNTAATPAQNERADAVVAKADNPNATHSLATASEKRAKNTSEKKQPAITAKQSAAPKQIREAATTNSASGKNDDYNVAAPTKDEPAAKTDEPSTAQPSTAPTETTPAPQEKKKKLRDKIFDIFHKKPEEQKSEEAKPAETNNGERRATHREDGASLAQMVSIRFDVPNDWMMGIKGAKATLVNRSSEKVGKATVEVLYYDDDNNLLQKKIVTFSNVDGKDSKTISIPDHSSATRVDYNLVSVEGKPAA